MTSKNHKFSVTLGSTTFETECAVIPFYDRFVLVRRISYQKSAVKQEFLLSECKEVSVTLNEDEIIIKQSSEDAGYKFEPCGDRIDRLLAFLSIKEEIRNFCAKNNLTFVE